VLGERRTGSAPLWLRLSLELPETLREGISVLWTDNGRPISQGALEAQSVLWDEGEHTIEARFVLADERRGSVREMVTVLPASQPAK
jgi:hypothetical protein